MWSAPIEDVPGGQRYIVCSGDSPISYRNTVHLWQTSEAFRSYFINLLAGSDYGAYKWETPPLTTESIHKSFEFVMLDTPSLVRAASPDAFANQFQQHSEGVIQFPNLGRDAEMVVPCPTNTSTDYCHLAAFSQTAPLKQQHLLWQKVGEMVIQNLSTRPKWLSTAGEGVAWLHVRLDDRPKYYGYGPYCELQ